MRHNEDSECTRMTQFNAQEKDTSDDQSETEFCLPDLHCVGMSELPSASTERARTSKILRVRRTRFDSIFPEDDLLFESSMLFKHLAYGLAYTTGSALGATPPRIEDCLAAYQVPNSAGLTAGARAWSKHCHRSKPPSTESERSPLEDSEALDGRKRSSKGKNKTVKSGGWWGSASGSISVINENSLTLFWKIVNGATWRNLHWLPHQVLVYEVRIHEGYGMRWAQDLSQSIEQADGDRIQDELCKNPWIFRGFLEPQMENGHEVGWRHIIQPAGPKDHF